MSKIDNTIMQPEPEEIWREWQDGDDSALWDEGYEEGRQQGYYEGILKAVEIIDSVRNTPNAERVPFHLTMSVVAGTLRTIANGESNE
jgi:hypothetical protein